MPLGKDAVAAALNAAGLRPDETGLFAVASCTGYVTPGLDTLVSRDPGMAPRRPACRDGHAQPSRARYRLSNARLSPRRAIARSTGGANFDSA